MGRKYTGSGKDREEMNERTYVAERERETRHRRVRVVG